MILINRKDVNEEEKAKHRERLKKLFEDAIGTIPQVEEEDALEGKKPYVSEGELD
jgi:hypothetical protein